MKLKLLVFTAALFIFSSFTNFNKVIQEQPLIQEDVIAGFSSDKFAAQLKNELNGKTMGYGFAIYQDGSKVMEYSNGLKRVVKDGGELDFDNTSRLHIASMSKTLTAIATTQLLKKDGIEPDTKIKDYLPPDWEIGPNVEKITFRDLMTHRSGIRDDGPADCNGETYKQLECKIKTGVQVDSMAVHRYQNMNFALLRILIPKLEGYDHLSGEANDTSTAYKYIRYVNDNIFNKCGFSGRGLTHPDLTENVWYYHWPYENVAGQRFYDYALSMGAYGWYVSVDDYAKIINTLFNSNELLDGAWRDTMTTDGLGCYTYRGKHGGYFWHNGGWTWSDKSGSGQLHTCWMYYPNNVICVSMVNSDIPGWFPDILAHAYDKAWKKQ